MKNLSSIFTFTLIMSSFGCNASTLTHEQITDALKTNSFNTTFNTRKTQKTYKREISFKPGSFFVDVESMEAIAQLVNDAKIVGEIDDIKVITWADASYPGSDIKELSDDQKNLAKARSKEVKLILNSYDRNLDVDIYNMTERPGKVATFFRTEDAEFKKALEETLKNSTPTTGKALVMVILK